MPFDRDTLPSLIDRGAGEFESRMPGVLARLRNSAIGVLNRVLAGGLSALQKYAEKLNDQWWPDICDAAYLPNHGARWGVPRLSAASATGSVHFTGIDGSAIALGTVVQRSDGVQYATTLDAFIAAGIADVPVRAVVAGQAGNAAIATALTLTSPVAGVNSVTSALTALSGGADIEDIEAWRTRLLARIRKPPQGGADFDYVAWAKEVPGVTRVWVHPLELGLPTVVIRFVRDNDADLIPDAGEVATVQAKIDSKRPVTAVATVVAPVATPQNFTIALTPDTPAIRAAVQAELQDVYRREAEPGATMLITHQDEAISIAAGEFDHVMTVPAANQAHAAGQLPTLGVITWV